MELVYSLHSHPACVGRVYRNPRFFAGPEEGATSVLIVGSWPAIAEAYDKAGVAVVQHGAKSAARPARKRHRETPPE